ncbi:hypothetical protein ACWQEN_002930 [Morganella morganii]|uniref:hypothetical protein n=1 Tax=Morganellaceae TaxID=1903414 RepID=UPI0028B67D55|nr:hypothetical protein [Morganella morganii]
MFNISSLGSSIPHTVKIIVEGMHGDVLHSQKLSDFVLTPNIDIQMSMYGNSLLDILISESYITPDLNLKLVTSNDPKEDATRLMGSIAEAVVVKYCNDYPEVNRILGMHARAGQIQHSILDQYVAVATGSLKTQTNYQMHYNPCDTQRDILWVSKKDNCSQLLCINPKPSSNGGIAAGLQVKASTNGIAYVVPNIKDYYFPVLYFDLENDFDRVEAAVRQKCETARLIRPGEIHHEMKHVILGYYEIIKKLLNNEITIQRIIEASRYTGDTTFLSGLSGGSAGEGTSLILPGYIKQTNGGWQATTMFT